ncbi:MAG: amidohydrolase family protein [Actinomycetota bacterium]|nr:amidohydrolase family protein [Actinomycetota bacterium]
MTEPTRHKPATDRRAEDHAAWIARVSETAIEPELPICDPHHHLWLDAGHTGWPYTLADLHADTSPGRASAHNVVRTVFLECHAEYRTDGPAHLRPVGETEFVTALAEQTVESGKAEIAGIVGSADLRLGDAVAEVIDAHVEAGRGRFRGIRYITAQDPHPPLAMGDSAAMDDPQYLAGVRTIGSMGFNYDAMVYHPQLPALVEVCRACPDTPIVIDHLGGILGTGPYKDRRDEILSTWLSSMSALAACDNTFLKVGGIGMPMMGYRWDKQAQPPTSEELAAPWADPIHAVIDLFGPQRCMFESNFPVDKRGAGYTVLWNAFKRIAAGYSADEKRDLFHDAAARAYRLTTLA